MIIWINELKLVQISNAFLPVMNYIRNYALASYGIFALIIDRTLIEEYHIQRYIYIIIYVITLSFFPSNMLAMVRPLI